MRTFVHSALPQRVLFGAGTIEQVGAEVERLGASRVLLLCSPSRRIGRARDALGSLLAAEFHGAAMHTPVEVTEQALDVVRDHDADCLVAVGGGSAVGLAKALSVRTGLPQIVVPTTYAGSEATPVLGETASGEKTTRSAPEILPGTVIYDVDLTAGLPADVSVTSGANALAHAVEALYSAQADPITDALALSAVAGIGRALAGDLSDMDVRGELLESAWLAGTCLGSVGMALHHKLCHALGGTLGLPHAPTHTVVLPHAMSYNAPAVPEVMDRIADALGAPAAPAAVYDLVVRAGGPTSLRELGMAESDIDRIAAQATARPYPNPRELDRDGIAALLRQAWEGRRPSG